MIKAEFELFKNVVIEGVPTKYWIGNKGTLIHKWKTKTKVIKPYLEGNKRYQFAICINGKIIARPKQARLVAEYFHSKKYNELKSKGETIHIHHIDQNKLNNVSSNLMVLTKAEHFKLHNELRKQAKEVNNNDI